MPSKTRNPQHLSGPSAETGHALRVWLLLDDRPGHVTQVRGLAHKMGWTPTSFNLKFNWLNWLPNPVLGHSLVSLDGKSRQQLQPPYPDIVVGMGRRIVPVARWIKRQSGGASRIVLLGRKAAGGVSEVDIFISCIHFNQVPRQGLVELVVPLTQVDSVSLASARAARPNPISRLKHPRVVLLVGGPTAHHRFDENDASVLASAMVRATGLLGGELAIVTSRRTPAAAVAALQRAAPQAQFEVWSKAFKDNPYLSYLAHADVLAVTGESESMLAEAAATGAPLTIYPLQAKPKGFKNFLAGALRRKADENGVLAKLSRQIILAGWMSPPRDLTLMHHGMVKRGLAEIFEGTLNTRPPTPTDEFEHLAQQLARLSRSIL